MFGFNALFLLSLKISIMWLFFQNDPDQHKILLLHLCLLCLVYGHSKIMGKCLTLNFLFFQNKTSRLIFIEKFRSFVRENCSLRVRVLNLLRWTYHRPHCFAHWVWRNSCTACCLYSRATKSLKNSLMPKVQSRACVQPGKCPQILRQYLDMTFIVLTGLLNLN